LKIIKIILDKPKRSDYIIINKHTGGAKMKNQNAVELGKLGRNKNTEAQADASKENGKKGGRPKSKWLKAVATAQSLCGDDNVTIFAQADSYLSSVWMNHTRHLSGDELGAVLAAMYCAYVAGIKSAQSTGQQEPEYRGNPIVRPWPGIGKVRKSDKYIL
jgi:hypothetical protein